MVTLYKRVDPVRKQHKRPLTFTEAMKRGQDPGPSVKQAGVTPVRKTTPHKGDSMSKSNTPIRRLIEDEIDTLARDLITKSAHPLTIEQARVTIMEQHPDLYTLHRSVDDTLTMPELAKRLHRDEQLGRLGFSNYGDAVAKTASELSPDDFTAGLKLVSERYPTLWAAYKAEERG